MNIKTLLLVLQIIISVVLIIVVLMQPSKTDGLSGFIGGGSDTFFSKNKSRTSEAALSRITIVCAILFAAIAIAQNILK